MTAASVQLRRRVLNSLAGVVLFAALTPLITWVLAISTFFSQPYFSEGLPAGRQAGQQSGMSVGVQIYLSLYFLQIAYMMCAVPAALAGVYAGHLRHRLHAPKTWLAIGVLETTLTLGLIMLMGSPGLFDPVVAMSALSFFIAGTGCAWLLGRLFAWRDRRRGSEAPYSQPVL
jgi:hypothetical protein